MTATIAVPLARGMRQTRLSFTSATTTTNSRWTRRPAVPLSIPSSQQYYWTRRWQQDERESLAEIAAGDSVNFRGPNAARDAAAWLLADD